MRQIVDPIAIQIQLELAIPEIANAVDGPATAGNIGGAGFDRMQIVRENIFREPIAVGVRAETQSDVILRHAIAGDLVFVALIERKTNGVLGNLVLFEPAAIGRLKNESVSAMAAVADETIATHDQFFREHDRGAGGIFRERVVFENISVRIHVVQAVADVMDEIVFDARIVRERKINPVARVADFVTANQIAFAIPLVNSVAAAI